MEAHAEPAALADWTIFVGAGISRDSGCPLFGEFWLAFLQASFERLAESRRPEWVSSLLQPNPPSDLRDLVISVFPPEQAFYRLASLGNRERKAIVSTVRSNLSGHLPNSNHVALAMMLAAGAQVWTTNYDTLIESAVGNDTCHVIAWPNAPVCAERCGKLHILKPHGTFKLEQRRQPQLIFEAREVLALPDEWKAAFAEALNGRHVIVAGHSGKDFDLIPVLIQEAASGSIKSGVWYESDNRNRERLRTMLPPLFDVPSCENPSLELRRACERLLTTKIPELPRREPEKVTVVGFPASHLAAAMILSHFGDPGQARSEWVASVRTDALRYKRDAAERAFRSLLFDTVGTVGVKRPLQAIIKPLRRSPVHLLSMNAWYAYLQANETYGSAMVAKEIETCLQTGRTLDWPFAVRTSAAAILKRVGPLDAVSRLIRLEELPRQVPSQRGKGVYNLLWSLRYAGDVEAWERLWNIQAMLSSLFDPNWAAWLRLEQADFACMFGDGGAGAMALQTSEVKFSAEYKRSPRFVIEYQITCGRTEMLAGMRPVSPEWGRSLLSQVENEPQLNIPFRRATLQITTASLLGRDARAEVLELLDLAEACTPSRLHRVLIDLLRMRHEMPGVEPQRLLEDSQRLGFGYGEALILSELRLPPASARLDGAKQLLARWSTVPTIWIVP